MSKIERPNTGEARAFWLAVGLSLGAQLGLAFVLYAMPAGHWSYWGADASGARHFADAYGLHPRLDERAFVGWMRVWLALAWLGYGAALVLARGGCGPDARTIGRVGAAVALVLAVLMPPSLSCDVYGYVAFARMPLVHGLGPYTHSPLALKALGDPAGPFLQWDFPSPYGPLWTDLSIALVAPLQRAPLLFQVLAFKLLGAGALIGLAAVARALAERLAPGRGALAVLAIGCNPLLLVEGAGSGHNDLVFLLPLVAAVLWALRGRFTGAAALLGLSIAVKLASVLVLPWLLLVPGQRRRPWLMIVLALGPLVLLQAPFGGAGTGLFAHLLAHAGPGSRLGPLLLQRWAVGLVFVASCLWVWRRGCVPAMIPAWVVASIALVLLGLDAWYPWYFCWPLVLAVVRWERPWLALVIGTNVLALTMMSFYTR